MQIRWTRSRTLVYAFALFVVAATSMRAQSGGTIAGTVIDQAGKTVPGAAVTVKNESGAASGSVVTDNEGHFSVTGLAAGTYSVETSEPGFARNTRLGVQVTAGGTQDLSITLFVDAVSQSVTVLDSIPVSWWSRVTVALGTTEPEASRTVPSTSAASNCASIDDTARSRPANSRLIGFIRIRGIV